MRRSLVLTDEAARHPFRASLPPHWRGDAREDAVPSRMPWRVTAGDAREFLLAYGAFFTATMAYIA